MQQLTVLTSISNMLNFLLLLCSAFLLIGCPSEAEGVKSSSCQVEAVGSLYAQSHYKIRNGFS